MTSVRGVALTIAVDTEPFTTAVARAGRALRSVRLGALSTFPALAKAAVEAEKATVAMRAMGDVLAYGPDWRWAQEVRLSGLEARWYVRGGLDPRYASEAARDREVKFLATTRQPRLAAAFLRGWAEHHDLTEPRPILAHHHRWGSQVVQVVAA